MSTLSPWSRETVRHLARHVDSLHVFDFDSPRRVSRAYSEAQGWRSSAPFLDFAKCVDSVHFLPSRTSSEARYVLSASALRAALEQADVDVLITLYGGGHSLIAFLSGFRPFAISISGSDVLKLSGSRRYLAKMCMRAAGAVFANGEYLAQRARDLAQGVEVTTLLHGIDTSMFVPGPRQTEDAAPDRPRRIICTRAFEEVYNNDYLLDALALLEKRRQDFHVVFVAGGPLLVQSKDLARRILSPTTLEKVEYLGGVPHGRLPGELSRSDIYVSLSRSDGTSTSLLEALACGLFPVVTDIPQNREWIADDGSNGILAPLDDPEALSEALERAFDPAVASAEAARYNRQQVVRRADITANTRLLASRLEQLVNVAPLSRAQDAAN